MTEEASREESWANGRAEREGAEVSNGGMLREVSTMVQHDHWQLAKPMGVDREHQDVRGELMHECIQKQATVMRTDLL